nr:cyclic nucleotide-binding domain-containing protein [uncultured Flavobacterium sp.]
MFVHLSSYLQTKADFTVSDLKTVEEKCSYISLKAGEKLLSAGSIWNNHAFVCKGLARGYQPDLMGDDQTVLFAPENYWTGDRESLLTGEPSLMNIVAETDCDIILINHEDYNNLCISLPAFSEFMSVLVQRNLESRQSQIISHVFSDEEKVENFIQKYPSVIERTEKGHIASFLSMDINTLKSILIRLS